MFSDDLLKVKSISFSSVNTRNFTVSWDPSDYHSSVQLYQVQWQATGISQQQENETGTVTSKTITGLTPGKAYNVTVIAINIDTGGAYRTAPLSKTQSSSMSITFDTKFLKINACKMQKGSSVKSLKYGIFKFLCVQIL